MPNFSSRAAPDAERDDPETGGGLHRSSPGMRSISAASAPSTWALRRSRRARRICRWASSRARTTRRSHRPPAQNAGSAPDCGSSCVSTKGLVRRAPSSATRLPGQLAEQLVPPGPPPASAWRRPSLRLALLRTRRESVAVGCFQLRSSRRRRVRREPTCRRLKAELPVGVAIAPGQLAAAALAGCASSTWSSGLLRVPARRLLATSAPARLGSGRSCCGSASGAVQSRP